MFFSVFIYLNNFIKEANRRKKIFFLFFFFFFQIFIEGAREQQAAGEPLEGEAPASSQFERVQQVAEAGQLNMDTF